MEILRWKTIAGNAAFHAARASWGRPKSLAYHGHDFAEIFWIDAGQGNHRINGSSVPLQEGSMVLIHPPDCHGISSTSGEDLKLTNIAFSRVTYDYLRERYGRAQKGRFDQQGKDPAMWQIEPSQLRRFNRWADELAAAPRETLFLERFMLNIIAELTLAEGGAAPDDAPDWLSQACLAIQKPENFSGGVERFLELCHRSREHVARTMQLRFGMTPTAYVNRIRMAYAQRQIEMGDRDILEISLDCGIGNLSHFYRLFQAHTGMTPRRYRLSHRKPL